MASHPLRVRELKPHTGNVAIPVILSHPLRVRELKHHNKRTVYYQAGVAPFTGA